MVTRARWDRAQAYERNYWRRHADARGEGAGLDFYPWRAARLLEFLSEAGVSLPDPDVCRILEIGSGPVGLISGIRGARRVALDPLADFFAQDPRLSRERDPGVEYRVGEGEVLPFDTGSFDLVVMENCIDHVRDPDAVLREIGRALAPGGVLYLTVNGRTAVGAQIHRVLSRVGIDAGHPHTFTRGRLVRWATRAPGLAPAALRTERWRDAFRQDLAGTPKDQAKALLGVSEFLMSILLLRSSADGAATTPPQPVESAREAG